MTSRLSMTPRAIRKREAISGVRSCATGGLAMAVTISWLDRGPFMFKCTNCMRSKSFIVGVIPQDQMTLDCSFCACENDLSIDPNWSNLAQARETAFLTDRQATRRGEIVKRLHDT